MGNHDQGGGKNRRVLEVSPCYADEVIFDLQMPLIRVIKGCMPNNDKMVPAAMDEDALQRAIDYMSTEVARAVDAFKTAQGEEQDRQHKSSIFIGIKSIVPPESEMMSKAGPVIYEQKQKVGGKRKSPNIDMDNKSKHGGGEKKAGTVQCSTRWICHFKTFVKDLEMQAWMRKQHPGVNMDEWLLKLVTEAKWGLKQKDIFQASLNGCKEIETRLLSQLPVERIYIHVWGKDAYQYGILDVFGYVGIENGKVKGLDSFNTAVQEMRACMGERFEEESFANIDVQKMQSIVMDKETILREKYGVFNYPTKNYLVGILYINPQEYDLPTGSRPVSRASFEKFYQGLSRIVQGDKFLDMTVDMIERSYMARSSEITQSKKSFAEGHAADTLTNIDVPTRFDWEETDLEHILEVEFAGVDPNDFKVQVGENLVEIVGTRRKRLMRGKVRSAQMLGGEFKLRFQVPYCYSNSSVKALLSGGILTLIIKKQPEPVPSRMVDVQVEGTVRGKEG